MNRIIRFYNQNRKTFFTVILVIIGVIGRITSIELFC